MTEPELRSEIKALAPNVEVDYGGPVQTYEEPEAIVRDPWGQYLWSHYKKEHGLNGTPKAPALPGQLSLF
jgi:hypothetical protein